MTIWVDKIPSNYILIMRGCAGLGAIIFVVIVGILSYRVNKPHISNRKKNEYIILYMDGSAWGYSRLKPYYVKKTKGLKATDYWNSI